jgi:ABC-2 type transport system ATP-binding protein
MKLFTSFYSKPIQWQSLLKQIGLEEKENSYYEKLSGGQKKRLHIALSLIGNPKIVFFDELTTGLDPQARRNMWDMILQIRKQGKTIFFTTHYMEEAEKLCDRVCIIDYGKIIAMDRPQNLIQKLDAESKVTFTSTNFLNLKTLQDLSCVSKVEKINNKTIIYGKGKELLTKVVQAAQTQGVYWKI